MPLVHNPNSITLSYTIEGTTEYEVFTSLPGNRPVTRAHVEALKKSIQTRDLLRYKPIIVNGRFQVIDGQHRLCAARELNIPIFYVVGEDLTYEEAGIFNACSDDWEQNEYLEMYAEHKNAEYTRLKNFLDVKNLPLRRLEQLMTPLQRNIYKEKFKTGDFMVIDNLESLSPQIDKMKRVIEFLSEITLLENKRFLRTDNFWRALNLFYGTHDIDHDKFLEKLSVKFQSIRPQSGYKDYYNTFMQIYNWKSKNKIESK